MLGPEGAVTGLCKRIMDALVATACKSSIVVLAVNLAEG